MSEKKPWHDRETLEELYVEKELSCNEIAERFPVTGRTINEWVRRVGIETRSASEAKIIAGRRYHLPTFETYSNGYERCETFYRDERSVVFIHRLLAVAEYGFEAVKGKHVHHKNGIPWDNRPENIEILTPSEHATHHYEAGDVEGWGPEEGLIAQHGAEAVLGPNEQYGSKAAAEEARQRGGGD